LKKLTKYCRFSLAARTLQFRLKTLMSEAAGDVVDRPQFVCEQVRYEASPHGTSVTMECLVRSHPAVSASQAVFIWTSLAGRNESITAGQRDGHYFADLRPAVRLSPYFSFFIAWRKNCSIGAAMSRKRSLHSTRKFR